MVNRSRTSKRSKPIVSKATKKRQRKKVWKIVLITLLVITLLGVGSGTGLAFYFLRDLPSPDNLDQRFVPETSKIYDRTGEIVLYEIYGEERREQVEFDEISDTMKDAILSAEDKTFYEHHGFDPRGIARALRDNTTNDSRVGGSTITQQLIKNTVLSSEKTFARKFRELVLAIQTERVYSKDEILLMYLNEIPFGSNAYGVESASQTFFAKSAAELELHEAATLAALPKAPTFYSPYGSNVDALLERRNWILDRMVDDGHVTREEADAAKEQELHVEQRRDDILAGHFVDMVREDLVETFGEVRVREGGLHVYTTIDMGLQERAERLVAEGVQVNRRDHNATNSSLVAIDPRNGEVLAMQGSANYFDIENDGQVNVTNRMRQPGSTMKPIVYAAAFEKGYLPQTQLFDLDTTFPGGYNPGNFDGGFFGPVSIRTALGSSRNIPAIKAAYLAGIADVVELGKRLGMTSLGPTENYGLAFAIGAGEVPLVEMASAYGVFANDGVKQSYITIQYVEDASGAVLLDNRSREGERIVSEQTAREISSILSDDAARAPLYGRGSRLNIRGHQVAVKTGSTEFYRDGLTIGYTPELVVAVWSGNNDFTPMKFGSGGFFTSGPIWNKFMTETLAGRENIGFPQPAGRSASKPMLNGQLGSEQKVTLCKPTLLLATDRCPESMKEEKTYRKVHSILYYVDRNNPLGPAPSNPKNDPQFEEWESAVRAWASGQEYEQGDPPTEFDDTHDPEDAPVVSIDAPASGAVVEPSFTVSVSGSAEHGVKSVELIVNGSVVASAGSLPASLGVSLPNDTEGPVTVQVRVTDQIDNVTVVDRAFTVEASQPEVGTVSIVAPSFGAVIQAGQSMTIRAVAPDADTVDRVVVRVIGGGSTVHSAVLNGTGTYTTTTGALVAGNYQVSVTPYLGAEAGGVQTASFRVNAPLIEPLPVPGIPGI